jgi:YidC/Oxa1 family membrane protein insertase
VDKRFITFLVLVFLTWTTFFLGRALFVPEKPPIAKQDAAAKQDEKAGQKPGDQGKAPDAEQATPDKKSPDGTPADEPPADEPNKPAGNQSEIGAAPGGPVVARKSVTIGSLDPASGYRMLVTLDNRGAALERAELSSPRFRSIEDDSGYLGHLGFARLGPDATDARVQIVGPGTPAALAKSTDAALPVGLQPGDVIREINKVPIASGDQLEAWLKKNTRPGQTVDLTVDRTTAGKEESHKYQASLIRRPVDVVAPERSEGRDGPGALDPLSMLLTLETLQGQNIKSNEDEIRGLPSMRHSNWEISEQTADSVTFSMPLDAAVMKAIGREGAGSLVVKKKYSLPRVTEPPKPGTEVRDYHLALTIEIENTGDEPLALAYRMDGPNGIPLEGWWYSTKLHRDIFRGAGARDVLFQTGGQPHHMVGTPMIFDHAKKALKDHTSVDYPLMENTGEPTTFDFLGVDAQFFAAMVLPIGDKDHPAPKFARASAIPMQDVALIPKTRIRTLNTSVRMVTPRETIEAGKSLEHNYQIFLGPKDPEILAAYKLGSIIEFGWQYAAYPAKFLAAILHWLYAIIGNYGIAIIMLTVLVRTCMLPFSIRQSMAAKRMQEISQVLKPEITALKEKYKDDPLKQHQATQELMKKHGMPNPFAGCLLVFFQLPVFVGLYRCLSVDINLRDASLIPGISWASNLAGPDKLFYWGDWSFMPGFIVDKADGWLGPFFNVLPLVTIALFIIQQKLFTPPPTDEQQEVQQQTMTIMSVMMGVFFYKVPAGLCLYFITSSLWSVAERTLLPKSKPIDPNAPVTKKTVVEAGSNGSTTRAPRKQKKR